MSNPDINLISPFCFQISQTKLNPERLATSQPVMILHQMCPQIVYNSIEKMEGNAKSYQVTAEINGQVFSGEGKACYVAIYKTWMMFN